MNAAAKRKAFAYGMFCGIVVSAIASAVIVIIHGGVR